MVVWREVVQQGKGLDWMRVWLEFVRQEKGLGWMLICLAGNCKMGKWMQGFFVDFWFLVFALWSINLAD